MRIILFINGEAHNQAALRALITPDDLLFGVDGGTDLLARLGLRPDRIIGDLDSIDPQLLSQFEAAGVAIERYPREKDKSDLELALDAALAQDPSEVVLIAALGGRIDHTLGNLFLLLRPELERTRVSLFDGHTRAHLVRPNQPLEIEATPGQTISLVPLSLTASGVTLSGTKWPLNNEPVHQGSSRTISNIVESNRVSVAVSDGLLLVIVISRSTEGNRTEPVLDN